MISILEIEKDEHKGVAQRIKNGDVDCLIQWIGIKKSKLYKMAWSYLRNHADVEDVFHNTIIKVMENADKLRNEEAFEGWFISILLNECRRVLRDKKRVEPTEEIEYRNNNKGSGEEDTRVDLMNGLKGIDEDYRRLIILKYYGGYSQREIAEILNMPLGTVKTKIFRGLRALRDVLRREG